jgi:hypothetical protein
VSELPIRAYFRRYLPEHVDRLTDEELIHIARLAALRFKTTFAGRDLIPIVNEVKEWGIPVGGPDTEVGGHSPTPVEAGAPSPTRPVHRGPGWWYERTSHKGAIDWREIVDFECDNPKDSSAKWRAIRERFGLSRSQYLLRLQRVCETPEAQVRAPLTTKRVLGRRDELRALRTHPVGTNR